MRGPGADAQRSRGLEAFVPPRWCCRLAIIFGGLPACLAVGSVGDQRALGSLSTGPPQEPMTPSFVALLWRRYLLSLFAERSRVRSRRRVGGCRA
jgi:hypothetical protein